MKNIFLAFFIAISFLSVGQVKWTTVEHVYADLVNAVGDATKIAPPIKSSTSESKVAYYSPGRQTIFVEEKFLEICSGFGADSLNAIAFILGHELAHVFRNHGWVSTSGMGYVDSDMKRDWKAMRKDNVVHSKGETEADIFSGFYSLVAGYKTMDVAGKVLRTVYQEYGIPDSIAGYPTLRQRVGIAETSMKKSRDLFAVFQVGLYCLAIEEYELSAKLFTQIFNQDYTGSEILNNLAIAEILDGYNLLNEDPRYAYPIFISTETALNPDSRGNEGEDKIRRGIGFLKQALEKEKNPSTLINLASAYAMLNEFVDAEYYLKKAENINPEIPAISNLQAILDAKQGNIKTAKKTWKKHRKEDDLAALNYAYASSSSKADEGQETEAPNGPPLPVIDNVQLDDPALRRSVPFNKIKLPGLKVSYAELDHSIVYEVYAGSAKSYRFQEYAGGNGNESQTWRTALRSNTSTLDKASGSELLRVKNEKTTYLIKYVKN